MRNKKLLSLNPQTEVEEIAVIGGIEMMSNRGNKGMGLVGAEEEGELGISITTGFLQETLIEKVGLIGMGEEEDLGEVEGVGLEGEIGKKEDLVGEIVKKMVGLEEQIAKKEVLDLEEEIVRKMVASIEEIANKVASTAEIVMMNQTTAAHSPVNKETLAAETSTTTITKPISEEIITKTIPNNNPTTAQLNPPPHQSNPLHCTTQLPLSNPKALNPGPKSACTSKSAKSLSPLGPSPSTKPTL
jgi:hypothetical protein